jgi:hypothetical protein
MARVSGSAWPWLLADDSQRIIGVRAPDGDETYLVQQWYGAWRSTEDQAAETINTATAVTLNQPDVTGRGIEVVDDTKITVNATGIYELSASFQLSNATGQLHNVKLWVRVQDVDFPNSARIVYVPTQHAGGPGHATLGASYFFPLNAGQHAQVMWSTPSLDVTLETIAADGGPAVPSVFLTMARIA